VNDKPVFGLVLTGGKSRRMGRDKALLERDGQPQLKYIVGVLEACVDKVYVSMRSEQANDEVRSQYAQIVDRFDNLGPVAGILSALLERPEADWLVVACDLPNIDERTIRYLLSHRHDERPFTAFSSSHDGLPEPLCAVYRSGCAELMQRFVDEGINCPRKILMRSETELLQQPDPRSLDNVNTLDDLRDSLLQAAR